MRKKKGSIDVSLMLVISIFILVTIFVSMVNYLQPVTMYMNINSKARKYILTMEREGGLSPSNLQNLKQELTDVGLDMSKVTITATPKGTVSYGDEVSLEIKYAYKTVKKQVDGLNVTNKDETIVMRIVKATTSKKG